MRRVFQNVEKMAAESGDHYKAKLLNARAKDVQNVQSKYLNLKVRSNRVIRKREMERTEIPILLSKESGIEAPNRCRLTDNVPMQNTRQNAFEQTQTLKTFCSQNLLPKIRHFPLSRSAR